METLSQLAKKAIELEPVQRIRLVEAILHSLDKPDRDRAELDRGIGSSI
jgi:hypothetical protein